MFRSSGMPRYARHSQDINADQFRGVTPAIGNRGFKQNVHVRRRGQPGVIEDLLLKLAFLPGGVAQGHQHFRRLLSGTQRFEHVARGRNDGVVRDANTGREDRRRMQDKTAILCEWPAQHHRFIKPDFRQTLFSRNFQLIQNPFNLQVFQRFVDDNAHRAVFIVFTNINHGAAKNRILESRHGNKKVML
ncbi:hypothetical protein EcWSU1_03749 [Enterobacter ludwigii]|uniref:Uncharacterized protein n=1 Tax=Enterobacter ludwigii TaxID=299767 RepID=G8LDY2_9ENTR|nr:hypothetical protein EcWSU1_03749 [Enterobacter ludwigii]